MTHDSGGGRVAIPAEHLKIEALSSQPPGGQHVLDRYLIIRVTHLPSGLVAQSGAARSQHTNRSIALDMILAGLTHPSAPKEWLA